jgi:hypothetical protein
VISTDLYAEKMRFEAVKLMSKAYRPTLPVRYVAQVLGFMKNTPKKENETTDKSGIEECEQWLKAHGAVLKSDGNGELQLDGKVLIMTSSFLYHFFFLCLSTSISSVLYVAYFTQFLQLMREVKNFIIYVYISKRARSTGMVFNVAGTETFSICFYYICLYVFHHPNKIKHIGKEPT